LVSSTSFFPLPLSFHQFSIHIFMCMLLLSEGCNDEDWKASKNTAFFKENPGSLALKVLSHLPGIQGTSPEC
jgi:hypothetical protein